MSITASVTPTIDVIVRLDGPAAVEVTVLGDAVVKNAPMLRRLLAECSPGDARRIRIDLSVLEQLDAAGLMAVTSWALARRRRQCSVEVVAPVGGAARIAEMSGVLPMFAPEGPR